MITIKDVAKNAQVSTSTVTKVLKNYPNIAESTRQKVLKTVKDLGYIPNKAASTLRSKSVTRIALYLYVNDRFQQIDEINMLYLLGAFDKAKELKLELVTVFNYSIEELQKEDVKAYFDSLSVDVIVLFGLNKEDEKIQYFMNNSDYKFVVVDADIHSDSISSVMINHAQAQYDVAKEIVEKEDKVLYLAGKANGYVTDMRLEGIRKLQKDYKLQLTVKACDFSETKAYETVLKCGDKYDSIVCASDLMAIGAKKALKKLQHFTKLSGFDGIRLMGYVAPDVVSCQQNFYEVGKATIDQAHLLQQGNKGIKYLLPYTIKKIDYQDIIK